MPARRSKVYPVIPWRVQMNNISKIVLVVVIIVVVSVIGSGLNKLVSAQNAKTSQIVAAIQ